MKTPNTALSRREFARRAALGTAVAVSGGWRVASGETGPGSTAAQQSPQAANLSPQSAAEAESRYQTILQQYGDRFSDAQKADIKHVCLGIQQNLDKVRAYSLSNGDQPALYLKPLVEREKKSGAPPNLKLAPSPGDRSAPSPGDKNAPAAPTAKPAASAERSGEWRVASGEKSEESGNPIGAGANPYKPGSGKP